MSIYRNTAPTQYRLTTLERLGFCMNISELTPLGWQPSFQQQLSLQEWDSIVPARIVDYQRSVFTVSTGTQQLTLAITPAMPAMTVGDWVLLDTDKHFVRLLERASLFSRKAAGTKVATQLIAANIDTVFIVCSMNQDFSLNRIERYLTLCHEARVEPVIVLTKIDLCANPDDYIRQAENLGALLMVVAVNALDPHSVKALAPWCTTGKTVALLGSSGVGKSSLVNTLLGETIQTTGAIRAADDEGRHTTTSRSLHFLPDSNLLADGESSGGTFSRGLLLDTPGMRELQLVASEDAVAGTFADISELSEHCKFADCQHRQEPGCAVLAAVEAGELDERRLASFHKLLREQAFNAATLAEKRAHGRKLGKLYRTSQQAHDLKRGD